MMTPGPDNYFSFTYGPDESLPKLRSGQIRQVFGGTDIVNQQITVHGTDCRKNKHTPLLTCEQRTLRLLLFEAIILMVLLRYSSRF